MSDDMVKRVAQAIRAKIATRHQGLPKGGWDGLMKMAALAAIEAMREPTEDMRKAALADIDDDPAYGMHEVMGAWRGMIDAALVTPALPDGEKTLYNQKRDQNA